MQTEDEFQLNIDCDPDFRNVTSTAKLFNFRRPVYMTAHVWEDCVELSSEDDNRFDELIVLQRLRHVLFMAASALQGRVDDFEQDFCVFRVPDGAVDGSRRPQAVNLKLASSKDKGNQPIYTILPAE